MAEMNPIARFFVNTFTRRVNARRYRWLTTNLKLSPGASCLEIGCGNGNLATRILDGMAPDRYVATDLDPHQIDVARRQLARHYPHGLPGALELRTANMLELPFPEASFDAVFAYTVLHHASAEHRDFGNVPRALAEVDRVLRPGGSLVYEEFLHKDRIRAWLREHGYVLVAGTHHWGRETMAAVKPREPPSSVAGSTDADGPTRSNAT
ncbi:MAG TPA: class I SAM-dependent methyltransferase [Thermoplasmata archaeon]|nr:class I SAM-dependent methyltransferase [Thermoplasmata archaeon]